MAHHILGQSRTQTTLFLEALDDFVTKGLESVGTEMSLSVLAYNLKRMMSIMGMSSSAVFNGCFTFLQVAK
jgi:hypothetical protein